MGYTETLKKAEKEGLVVMAYGGVAMLMAHEVQKEKGIFDATQYKCGLAPHQSKLKKYKQ
jgi:hypothetical protein